MKDAYPQRTNCTAICCMKGFTLLTLSLCYDWVTWCFALLVKSWAHRTQLRSLQGLPSLHPRGSPCHSASHFPVLPFPLMLIPRCPVLLSPCRLQCDGPGLAPVILGSTSPSHGHFLSGSEADNHLPTDRAPSPASPI